MLAGCTESLLRTYSSFIPVHSHIPEQWEGTQILKRQPYIPWTSCFGSKILGLSETHGGLSKYEEDHFGHGSYETPGPVRSPPKGQYQTLLFPGEAEVGDLSFVSEGVEQGGGWSRPTVAESTLRM